MDTSFEAKVVGTGPRGEGAFAIHQYFHDAASAAARRNRVFVRADYNGRGDFAHSNARERDRIVRVEIAFSACVIGERH